MSLVTFPRQFLVDANGLPRVGAKANFYQSGTTTRITTYTTGAYAVEHANPVLSVSGSGFFPAVYVNPAVHTTYKMVITDSSDVTLYTEDNIPTLGFTPSDIGSTLNPLTDTEDAADAEPVSYAYAPGDVRRFGADQSGVADSTDDINDTVQSVNAGSIKGGVITFPGDANSVYDISATIDIPERTSGDNHSRWYSVDGLGRGGPRITAQIGLANEPMINLTGQDASTYSFYREVKNLYLNGNGIAQRGIELHYNQHFKVENVFISSLDDGTGTAAGIRVYGAICAQFRDVKVHNCDGNGINAYVDSGNFFNANLVAGCSFLDLTGSGMHIAGGSGCGFIGNTFEFCDEYGIRFGGYSGTCGFFGGNYLEANGLADIYVGEETAANSLIVTGNYLNGYSAGVGDDTYTPIKIKFSDGPLIVGNMANVTTKSPSGYLMLDANISGGTVENTIVHHNHVRGLASSTAPNTIYNLPQTWVDYGNSCIEQKFVPLVCSNLIRRGWHSGGWTVSTSGTGTVNVSSSRPLMGATSVRLVRPAASTASVAQTFALETGSPYKNRFVTLSVPVRANVSSNSLLIEVTPNGTSPQTASYNISSLSANQERIVYVLVFVPSDATQIAVSFAANATSADFDIGMPCLYIGASQWYSSYSEGDTSGTWTPIIGGSGGTSGQTYSSQVGYWTRNGALVFCSFDVTLSNKGTITTNVIIGGLPLVGLSGAGLPGMTVGYFSNLASNWTSLGGYVEGQNSQCFLTGLTAAAASASLLVTGDIANNTRIAGSFTYPVNQP